MLGPRIPSRTPRRRPRLRTLLFAANLVVLLLPLGGVGLLRLYESALVRQTESELLGQAAVLAAAWSAALGRATPAAGVGAEATVETARPARSAALDLAVDPVRPRPAPAPPSTRPVAPEVCAAAAEIAPILREAKQTTLAGIRVVDAHGTVVATTGEELGSSLAGREEVAAALRGETVALLRERVSDEPRPPLASLSRGSGLRVFVAMPALAAGRVAGAVVLSRSPRTIGETLWGKRRVLALAAAALLAAVALLTLLTARLVSGPLERVVEQTERAASGARGAVLPLEHPGTAEAARLSEAVARMARTLEDRADYLRALASHVSHEFKTPLAAIRGAVELLREHGGSMTEAERDRFLANAAGDADRLSRLVGRLLELARADLAAPGGEAEAGAVAAAAAARHGEDGLAVAVDDRSAGARVAVPAETLDAVLAQLLDNARQHGAGRAGVRVESTPAGGAAVEVADDGPGISPANAARVFEPFFTTARERGGTGLGLSIARALLAAHGGTIALVPGAPGTRFRIELPPPRA